MPLSNSVSVGSLRAEPAPSTAPSAKKRILLVDDDEAFLELSASRLEGAGYEVSRASSWAQTLPHLRQGVDMVLLDVHMTSLEGDKLCHIIKSHENAWPGLKVLLHSSEDEDELRRMAQISRADGYVSKSRGRDELLEKVRLYLS